MKKIKLILIPFAMLFMLLNTFNVQADDGFAEKHIVLQISQPERQTLVMNVANNIIKHYGQDKVAIEIVAFGPGLKILFANNEVSSPRIESLQASGVKFSACMNTMAAIKKKTGKEPKLNKHSVQVAAGVVQILDLVDKGYTLIKP
jgi:hypothetical protein